MQYAPYLLPLKHPLLRIRQAALQGQHLGLVLVDLGGAVGPAQAGVGEGAGQTGVREVARHG